MSEYSNSAYFTTMPGPDVVDAAIQLEYRVSCKALDAALLRNHEVLQRHAVSLDQLNNRRPPPGTAAFRVLLDRINHETEELEDLTARITNLRANIAHVLGLAHQQANERVAAMIMAYRAPSDHDEEPQGGSASLTLRER